MFSLALTMNVLLWVERIGGRGTVVGAIIGALVFVELQSLDYQTFFRFLGIWQWASCFCLLFSLRRKEFIHSFSEVY